MKFFSVVILSFAVVCSCDQLGPGSVIVQHDARDGVFDDNRDVIFTQAIPGQLNVTVNGKVKDNVTASYKFKYNISTENVSCLQLGNCIFWLK